MKLNLPLMKLIIKLLVLLILFVILFLISAFLYSVRYWPDVYNYINANITIQRIPTITELNITVYEVTTESDFTVTDDDFTDSTTDVNFEELSFDDFGFNRRKRFVRLEKFDNSDVLNDVLVDYEFDLDETSDIIDTIDETKMKLGNQEDVEMIADGVNGGISSRMMTQNGNGNEISEHIFPWIAAIFVKNDSSNQFNYFCDGAVLSNKTVITGARCLLSGNTTVNVDDLIVLMGKKSLGLMGENEKAVKIKSVNIHNNFTNEKEVLKDLAILTVDGEISFSDAIQPACIEEYGDSEESATTGWAISGELTVIGFDEEKSASCEAKNDTFCAVYPDDVTVCPSYGGVYAAKTNNTWCVQGIRYADPTDRGLCFDRRIYYTPLQSYVDWIKSFEE